MAIGKIIFFIGALFIIGFGLWLCISVGPNLYAFIFNGFKSLKSGDSGFYFKSSIGVLIIFLVGVALVFLGGMYIKSKLK